jgi:hypothetical protein
MDDFDVKAGQPGSRPRFIITASRHGWISIFMRDHISKD